MNGCVTAIIHRGFTGRAAMANFSRQHQEGHSVSMVVRMADAAHKPAMLMNATAGTASMATGSADTVMSIGNTGIIIALVPPAHIQQRTGK